MNSSLYAQTYSFCSTTGGSSTSSVLCDPILHSMNEKGPFFLRMYIHVIRRDNCTGGQSLADVQEALGYLDQAFNEHNIFFVWDCTIDEICNTSLYQKHAPGAGIFTDPNNNPHSNGIDIYLFPDHPLPNPIGEGLAADIGATALYVTGNYSFSPYGSRVKSHLLSHEMGHCLGLLHTHHGTSGASSTLPTGIEYVDQESPSNLGNCLDNGDCVCDTPADPNINNDVALPSCEWLGYATDPNSDYAVYEPSTNNIMSYTHDDCMKEFTLGQGKRMRNVIATQSILQDCLVEQYITTPTTWDMSNTTNGIVDVDGILTVESGASLTIESGVTVRFGKASRLIVKPNAHLVLKGTLTSRDCNNNDTWKGVEVWGNSSMPQIAVNGQWFQGRFLGQPTGRIENAEVAVQLWGPDRNSNSGGIIYCDGTTFINNKTGIDIFRYEGFYPNNHPFYPGRPLKYKANFSRCSFLTDSNYPHNENFRAFVSLFDVDGPRFEACSFENTYTPITLNHFNAYGYGIYSFDSDFSVLPKCTSNTHPCTSYTRSQFRGLGSGVYAAITSVVIESPYTVRQADFHDCFIGIDNKGIFSSIMLYNDFYMGNLPTTALNIDQTGIFLHNNINNFILQENDFIDTYGNENIRTIGISAYSIGTNNNNIRRNTFTNLNIGNQTAGVCASGDKGLLYECNFNRNNKEWDFLVCGSIKKEQEGLKSSENQADQIAVGNTFSNTGDKADRDFAYKGGTDLDYYYYEDAGVLEKPDEYSGISNLIDASKNTCPVSYCEPPCNTPNEIAAIKDKFHAQKNNYHIAYTAYQHALASNNRELIDQKQTEVAHYRALMDENGWIVLTHAIRDSLYWNRDTIRTWLSNIHYVDTEMVLAFDYLNTNQYQHGIQVLNHIPTKFDLTAREEADLAQAYVLYDLLSQQSVLYDLSENIIQQFNTIAQSNTGFASGIASNILSSLSS